MVKGLKVLMTNDQRLLALKTQFLGSARRKMKKKKKKNFIESPSLKFFMDALIRN